MQVRQLTGVPNALVDSMNHASNRDDRLVDALRRTTQMQAFLDVLVNFTDDVDSDQIDVAMNDAKTILRRLQSAKQHSDMV